MVNVAILGFGTVGSGVAEVLTTNGGLIDQRPENALGQHEGALTLQYRHPGEILPPHGLHLVRGAARENGGTQVLVHHQLDLPAAHGPDGGVELLCIENDVSLLQHLSGAEEADTLLQVEGGHLDAPRYGAHENALDGGEGVFVGDGAHQGRDGGDNGGAVKNNTHILSFLWGERSLSRACVKE